MVNKEDNNIKRCSWVNLKNELYIDYHDIEWGVEKHDDNELFEMLILEGAQAGLAWETVLNKRDNYRIAFDNFDPKIVSNYDEKKYEELLQNKGIIRNRLKIRSAIRNAKIFMQIQKEFGSFNYFIWAFVNNKPIVNYFKVEELPAKTELSDIISKDLKKRGMNFVGSTIIYAYMQSIGMVNDHDINCYKHI
ncbi:MAG: DNA-3-methyladenine glycosylase I [Bacteroidales bacterium]|nr:DNA-3-methyladenine glycosylase I [Bacteroidales bacterium]